MLGPSLGARSIGTIPLGGGGGYPGHGRGHIDIWSKEADASEKRWPRKPYRFFMCHHKADAGNLARLLKMELLKRTGNFKVCICPLLFMWISFRSV